MKSLAKWLDDRTGLIALCSTVLNWKVPATRCCGVVPTMIVFAFLVQAITGIVMWLYYAPSPQTSWESVFFMQYVLPWGWLVRGIHHFSAQVLVGLLVLYILMMVLHGTYKTPREFVFWSAIGLFLFSLCCCLTGDLLNWTLPGFSATKVRFGFLNLIPEAGPWLYKLAVGGADFGTVTPARFLLLHIAVFGGGFFVVLVLWKWFTIRARKIMVETGAGSCATSAKKTESGKEDCKKNALNLVPIWSCEAVKQSLGCVLYMGIVLVLVFQQPLLGKIDEKWKPNPELPFQSTVGAHLFAPADPVEFYGGARPEWSFRALYYLSNLECFPGDKKYIPIFVITSCIAFYFFLIPFIGRIKYLGHPLNVLLVLGLFFTTCFMTYKSYEHDRHDEEFQISVHDAHIAAGRMIELALSPTGIPPEGALSLLQSDPKISGREIYIQHCLMCHPFRPQPGDEEDPEFSVMKSEEISAPNLYKPLRAKWVAGFFDFERLKSEDYYGNTAFVLQPGQDRKEFHGKMYDYIRTLPLRMEDEDYMEENNPETLKKLIDVLAAETLLEKPRKTTLDAKGKKLESIEGLEMEDAYLFDSFGCLSPCHDFYEYDGVGKKRDGGDLSGYMSRQWMIEFIANPAAPKYLGERNDRMPLYHPSEEEAVLSMKEIELVVDFIRGNWYRKEPVPAKE